MSKNFTCDPSSVGTPVNVTTASAYTAIDAAAGTLPTLDVLVDNRGSSDIFVVFGKASPVLTATEANLRVPAGSMYIFRKNDATHMAAVTASGTSTVYVHKGEGR